MSYVLLFVAGGLGTLARYLVTVGVTRAFGSGLPWGTLTVNVLGCFLMAAIVQASLAKHVSAEARLVLTTGFLGGFTTYSAFNLDATGFARDGAYGLAAAYVLATLVGCCAAGVLGAAVVSRFL